MHGYLLRVKTGNPGITIPDYRDTHDLLSCVDALVSPLSTILIEGAVHGKPILCLLPEQEDAFGNFTRDLSHFEEFFSEPCFFMARTLDSLVPEVRHLISKVGDAHFAVTLKQASSHYVSYFDRAYSERLLDFIENLAVSNKS